MSTIKVSAKELSRALQAQAKRAPVIFAKAARITAYRSRTALVAKTPTDQGIMRNAWQVSRDLDGSEGNGRWAKVSNSAPHAGIIEGGARPHGVNAEGRAALTEWVIRKGLAADEKQAAPIVFGIVEKLKREGQKGLFIVRDIVPEVSKWLGDEFAEQLQRDAERTQGGT